MAGIALVNPRHQFFAPGTNAPLANGRVKVCVAGSTTLTNTWQDEALTVLNPNPIPLDANGACVMWTNPALTYKWIVQKAIGGGYYADVYTVDNIKGEGKAAADAAAIVAAGMAQPYVDEAEAWAHSTGLPDGVNKSAKSSALDAAASAGGAAGSATSAAAASAVAQAARDTAIVVRGLYATQADGVSNGVLGLASLVSGTGGTNGTFALGFSGGGGTGAAGYFTVAGASVTATVMTAPGRGYTSAPAVSFAASAGLTGASATAVIGQNTAAGLYYGVLSGAAGETAIIYQATGAGTSTDTGKRIPTTSILAASSNGSTFEVKDSAGVTLASFMLDGAMVARLRPRSLDAPADATFGGKSLARVILEDQQALALRDQGQWIDKARSGDEAPYLSITPIIGNAVDGTSYPQVRYCGVLGAADGSVLCWAIGTDVGDFGSGSILFKRVTYNKATRAFTVPALTVWESGAVDPDGGSSPGRWNATSPLLMHTGPNKGRILVMYIWMNPTQTVNRVFVRTSDDHGVSWSARTEVTGQFPMATWIQNATGPGQGIQIRHGAYKGRLVVPTWHGGPGYPNTPTNFAEYPYFGMSTLLICDDYGTTWAPGLEAPMDQLGNFSNECNLAEDWRGDLIWKIRTPAFNSAMFLRVTDGGTKVASDAWGMVDGDGAAIFCGQTMSGIIQGAERPKLGGAPKLLLSQPTNPDGTRSGGKLYLSYDGGLTFPYSTRIIEELSGGARNFGYSQPVILDATTYGVFFENTIDAVFLAVVNHNSLE